MSEDARRLLAEWKSLKALTLAQVRARFGAAEEYVDRETGYGRLKRLNEFHNPAQHPARLFFAPGEETEALLLYVGTGDELAALSPASLLGECGEPDAVLASRAGKTYAHYVCLKAGVAFSARGAGVAFVEVFGAMTLDEYKATLYVAPRPFVM